MNHKKLKIIQFSVLIFFVVQGCSLFSPISYYDVTTHRNLIESKVYTSFLYESFLTDSIDYLEIKNIKLKLALAYEYEKAKGESNKETAEMIKKIQEMFKKHVDERIKKGKWSDTYCYDKIENISDAYDIAISAELLKNKPK